MESDELPKLPSLEEVLKALDSPDSLRDGSREEDFSESRKYPIKMNCPILKRKTGDGTIEVHERTVSCEYFVKKTREWGGDIGCRVHLKGCKLKEIPRRLFGKKKFFPYENCSYYEQYADTHGDVHWTNPEDRELNLTGEELKEKWEKEGR
jgi:hypothetical protein